MSTDDSLLRTTTGVVLAGGRSQRFGDTEKALAEYDGRPMLVHVVETLASLTETVVVNCREAQRPAFGQALAAYDEQVVFAIDEQPDNGPLAGFQTALAAVETEYVLLLACDMPLVDADSLSALRSRIDDDIDAVVPQVDGTPVPTHAIYHAPSAIEPSASVLAAGDRSLQALLSRLRVEYLPVEEGGLRPSSLRSVDTQAELETLNRSHADDS